MYRLGVKRDFIASHYLVGGDWGPENVRHAHHYRLEVVLEGKALDHHGYLVDVCDVERALEGLVDYYRDRTLNELSAFEGLNPSLERFAAILCRSLGAKIHAENLSAIEVKLWENEIAWASFRRIS